MKFIKNNVTFNLKNNSILSLIISIWFLQPIYAQTLQAGEVNNSVSEPGVNQEFGDCGIHHSHNENLQQNPESVELRRKALKKLVKEIDSITTLRKRSRMAPEQVMIPVVFHYFYDECAPKGSYEIGTPPVYENFRFENAIERLNKDFSGITSSEWYTETQNDPEYNSDYIPNPQVHYPQRESLISFRLAEKDPYGNPTTGINRIRNSLTYAGVGDDPDLREVIQWPRNTYLNIYVVESIDVVNSSGVALYPEQSDTKENIDGAAIARWALDPTFDDGNKKLSDGYYPRDGYRYILSHEVGHWLGLRHLWGAKADHPGQAVYDFCDIDDFDFYTNLMNEYGLPNQNFNDTPCADQPQGNWNTEPNETFPCSPDSCPDGSIDYNLNVMDYSSWGVLFTEGQKDFMETIMSTSISQRNEIKDNNQNAFPVFAYDADGKPISYNNYNDPINMRSVVFSHGGIFFESILDNGTIENNVAEIELRGGLSFINPDCNCPYNYPATLTSDKYNFTLPPAEITSGFDSGAGVPQGLSEQVIITSPTTAQLVISGTTNFSSNDYLTKFGFSNSIIDGVIGEDMRSKIIKFDFKELNGEMYDNRQYSNIEIGPNAANWTAIYVDFLGDYLYLYYENNKFILKDFESVVMQGDYAKVFAEGVVMTGSSEGGDIEIDINSIPDNGDFYIGLGTSACGEVEELVSWLKLKYDENCNSMSISAFGINEVAGRTNKPTLLYTPSVITQMEDGSFEGCEVELIRSDPNQKFKTTVTGSNILNQVTVSNIVEHGNNNVTVNNGFSKNDLKFEAVINPNGQISNTKFSIIANTNNSNFWDNVSQSFAFKLTINQGAFNLLGSNLDQAEHFITVLVAQVEELQLAEVNAGSSYNNYFNDASLPIAFKEIRSTYDKDKIAIGFISYNDEISDIDTDKGYIFYSNTKYRFEGLCKPGSNELELLSYGESINLNNFKKLSTGGRSYQGGLLSNSVYIPFETINNYLNAEKYLCFKLIHNCQEYYGWVKFLINNDGSVSDFVIVSNNIPGEVMNIGQVPTYCPLNIESNTYFNIDDFKVNNTLVSVVQSDLTYTNFTDLIIPLNLNNTTQHNFKAKNDKQKYDGSGFWYAWIDYNRNGFFEAEELLFSTYNNTLLDIDVEFPPHLSGSYVIRLLGSFRDLDNPPIGCNNIYSGEVEDYTIEFTSGCPADLTLTGSLPSGDYKVSDKIQINANAGLPPSQTSNMQSACILLEPTIKDEDGNVAGNGSVLIDFGSVFCAEAIEDCGNPNLKQAKPVLNNTNFKVFPNPFSEQCNIEYTLDVDTEVTLLVSDITGKVVANLNNGENKNAGSHQAKFNAKGLSHGIYYCTLIAGDKVETQKMVISNSF